MSDLPQSGLEIESSALAGRFLTTGTLKIYVCVYIYIYVCVCVCVWVYIYFFFFTLPYGFPGSSDGKESTCSAVDLDSIHGLGSSPGEEIGYPLQ